MNIEHAILKEIGELNEKLADLEVGSQEYKAVVTERDILLDKAMAIEKIHMEADLKQIQLDDERERFNIELERKEKQSKVEKRDRVIGHVLDGVKFVTTSVIIPVVGLVWITAAEKEITFTGALREYTKCFLPKRN